MGTGYTYTILDEDDITFEKFAWNCSQAFIRDNNGINNPIKTKYEVSQYHAESLSRDLKTLLRFESMSNEEYDAWLVEDRRLSLERHEESLKNKRANREKYEAMLKKVEAWSPKEELLPLKEFMISQIVDSIDWDCKEYEYVYTSFSREEKIERCRKNVEFSKKALKKEEQRINDVNKWYQDLKEELGNPPFGECE